VATSQAPARLLPLLADSVLGQARGCRAARAPTAGELRRAAQLLERPGTDFSDLTAPPGSRISVSRARLAVGPGETRVGFQTWRRENPTTRGRAFTLLAFRGRGHVIGTILRAQALEPGDTQLFEGDEQG